MSNWGCCDSDGYCVYREVQGQELIYIYSDIFLIIKSLDLGGVVA